jgi:hypothetical protein
MRLPFASSLLLMGCIAVFAATAQAQQRPAAAAPAANDSEDLAKKLSNPISDLVSVPFQFNWEQKVGPLDLSRFILNVQPVIPFELNEHWNMIVRIILPFVGQPPLFDGDVPAFGVGDSTTSFFFSPRHTGSFTIGVGPAFVLPSSYQPTIGSGQYSLGPTVVALRQQGPWTYGALWNQVWSYGGDKRREDVNQMFLQPFLAYQATRTVTLTAQSESTANWEVDTDRWTVPINLLVSKLSTFGTFPASYLLGAGFFPEHPDIGPSWKVRAAITLLLPRKK